MKISRAASVSLLLGTSMLVLAGPATAETLTVNDIAIQIGEGITIPSVTVEGGNLSEEGLRALLSENPAASLASLATLDAKSVTIPEIRYTLPTLGTEAEPVNAAVVYHDLVLTNVADGVAESAVLGSTSVEGPKDVAFEFGEMTLQNFDISALLGFYGFTDGTVSDEMVDVYSSFTFAGGSITAPTVNCDIGGASGGTFAARPLSMSLNDMTALSQELEAAQAAGTEPTPEQISTMVLFYADMLTAFTSDPMTFEGFDCSGSGDKGEKFAVSSNAFTVDSFEPGIYPAFGLDEFGMSVEGENAGSVSFGNFTFKSIDFNDAIAAVRAAASLDAAWFEANWRQLVPAFEGLSMTDLQVDVPNPEASGDRIAASMANLDVTLGAYVNAIPSDIAMSIVDLVVPLPADGEPPIAELRARGINSLTLDAATSMIWNKADQTITVRDLALDAAELGSIRISGTLGNATEALFADTEAEALMAAQVLTVKDLTITLDDGGIGGLIVSAASAQAGQPEGALRTQVSGFVQGMTLAVLGNTDEALVAAQSLGKFLGGKARNVTITLTATDPAGLGIADVAAFEQDPTALSGKITIAATASGEPVTLPAPSATPAPADGGTQDEKLNLKN
jgi:hypothetical protein